jgi:malic enzyme
MGEAMKITDAMVEAAASAIRDVVANRINKGRPWNSLPSKLRDDYRAEATAALRAALRE